MNSPKISIVIHGVSAVNEIPGIENKLSGASVRCAPNLETLRNVLPGADVLLEWNLLAGELHNAWDCVDKLSWIQWGGAGVDDALFPELVESDIVLTNMGGIFDRAIAEYVLGLILSFAKDLPETYNNQKERQWVYRLSENIEGCQVLVIGVGGIGCAIGRMLKALNCHVQGVGRSSRNGNGNFSTIHAINDLDRLLSKPDYVVVAVPLTKETHGFFGAKQFSIMKPSARFINVGRGKLVDEMALVRALQQQQIAGAALDVFDTEPLPSSSPLWGLKNVIVSPHMAGDYNHFRSAMTELFLENLRNFLDNKPLLKQVDKRLGFVTD